MEINNKKDYKLVWRIVELLQALNAPWGEIMECYNAISQYNATHAGYDIVSHDYGVKNG